MVGADRRRDDGGLDRSCRYRRQRRDLDRHRAARGEQQADTPRLAQPEGRGLQFVARRVAIERDAERERKSVVEGESESGRVNLGGRRIIKKKKYNELDNNLRIT